MRMKRKLIIGWLLCAMLSAVLVGCGTPAPTEPQEEADGQKEEVKIEGIVPVEEWQETYPEEVALFLRNEEMVATTYGGSENYSYLEAYPFLRTLYDGYGFAKQYDRARGHVYALEDVLHTQRPKAGASCLACKTSEFTEALLEDGNASSINFDDFVKEHDVHVGMTCYDCHGETPGVLDIKRVHFLEAMKLDAVADKVGKREYACAQCHVEYYLDSETKDVILPWTEGLGCDEAYAYYQDLNFADWEHPGTGAKLLKAQHPEVETFDGSVHAKKSMDCIDCHMPMVEENGKMVRSHHWTSPLKNMQDSCMACHSDTSEEMLLAQVHALQKAITEKTQAVGEELGTYVVKLTQAVNEDKLDADSLEELQDIHREAQFYWDYVFVENSEGFHNYDKQDGYLDHADALIKQGLDKLDTIDL